MLLIGLLGLVDNNVTKIPLLSTVDGVTVNVILPGATEIVVASNPNVMTPSPLYNSTY